ncbi:MAG: hypothetical protein IPH58_01765 [Sphingobacteriales bacterium]|jgi:hypothetical protein|nr:hypothetical protein [Sphingobacteriales bacterium]
MKKRNFPVPMLLLSILTLFMLMGSISCKKWFTKNTSYTEISGDTNLDMNKVGSSGGMTLKLNGSDISNKPTATIVKNEGGIINIKLTMKVPDKLKSLVSVPYADASGNVNYTFKFKNTSEGIAGIDSRGKQCVFVRYDGKVGDSWSFTTKSGKTLQYKILTKSTTDDFPYAFFNIKVMTVEQSLPYAGFRKVIYKTNHKFGLVFFEVTMEDGTVLSSYVI